MDGMDSPFLADWVFTFIYTIAMHDACLACSLAFRMYLTEMADFESAMPRLTFYF
jgi:hypothetical protein